MIEFFVVRNGNRYDIIQDDINIVYGIRTGGFCYEKITFYSTEDKVAGVYLEKRRFLSKNIRCLIIPETNKRIEAKSKKASYFFNSGNHEYELRYALFNFSGFFLNGISIGNVEIIKTNAIEYTKRITLNANLEDVLFLVYFYIGVDYFDVN